VFPAAAQRSAASVIGQTRLGCKPASQFHSAGQGETGCRDHPPHRAGFIGQLTPGQQLMGNAPP